MKFFYLKITFHHKINYSLFLISLCLHLSAMGCCTKISFAAKHFSHVVHTTTIFCLTKMFEYSFFTNPSSIMTFSNRIMSTFATRCISGSCITEAAANIWFSVVLPSTVTQCLFNRLRFDCTILSSTERKI